jgi:hypothetical protein
MDHRINEISSEMSGLLEQQQRILNTPIANFSQEDLHEHAERNQRLRDLCKELIKVS